jgi:hypothetical protein
MLNIDVERVRVDAREHIKQFGLNEAARRLGVQPELLARVGAGAGVREGTLIAFAVKLGVASLSFTPEPRA